MPGPHGDTELSMQTVPEYGNMTDTCRDSLLESDQLIWGLDTGLSAKISQAIPSGNLT